MNNMFTDGVKGVMQLAREESARLGHNYIGTCLLYTSDAADE